MDIKYMKSDMRANGERPNSGLSPLTEAPCVKVGVSNRHIHLSPQDLALLFGENYALTVARELLPGQYACEETVAVAGKKGRLEKVRILAPLRQETQLEVSFTDSFTLGVPIPLNESGNLKGAGTVLLENPKNGARIERACAIAALRHIHLSAEFAALYGLRDKEIVSVLFEAPRAECVRSLRFDNVLLRIAKDFTDEMSEMHIDTDEANAAGIKNGDRVKILLPAT